MIESVETAVADDKHLGQLAEMAAELAIWPIEARKSHAGAELVNFLSHPQYDGIRVHWGEEYGKSTAVSEMWARFFATASPQWVLTITAYIKQLEAFKKYVHDRLDAVGVGAHEEQNAINGCRIGSRLDDVFLALALPLAEADEPGVVPLSVAYWHGCAKQAATSEITAFCLGEAYKHLVNHLYALTEKYGLPRVDTVREEVLRSPLDLKEIERFGRICKRADGLGGKDWEAEEVFTRNVRQHVGTIITRLLFLETNKFPAYVLADGERPGLYDEWERDVRQRVAAPVYDFTETAELVNCMPRLLRTIDALRSQLGRDAGDFQDVLRLTNQVRELQEELVKANQTDPPLDLDNLTPELREALRKQEEFSCCMKVRELSKTASLAEIKEAAAADVAYSLSRVADQRDAAGRLQLLLLPGTTAEK